MRLVAVLLLVVLLAPAAHGDDAVGVVTSTLPAPEVGAPVLWLAATSTPGWWFPEAKVIRIDGRIQYLEDKAAKECLEGSIAADKKLLTGSVALLVGIGIGLLAGGAAGLLLAKKL